MVRVGRHVTFQELSHNDIEKCVCKRLCQLHTSLAITALAPIETGSDRDLPCFRRLAVHKGSEFAVSQPDLRHVGTHERRNQRSQKFISFCLRSVTATIRNKSNKTLILYFSGFLGVNMRLSNGVELRIVAPDEDDVDSRADLFEICSRQSEVGALRRIEALEHENELLRRAASAIQLYLAGDERSDSRGWLDAIAWMLSREH